MAYEGEGRYHRDDFDSEDEWNDAAFRLGYDDGEQRERVLDGIQSQEFQSGIELADTRFEQGDYQSLGDIYADMWDHLEGMSNQERDDLIRDLFGYETA
jgi:hypothetical protein